MSRRSIATFVALCGITTTVYAQQNGIPWLNFSGHHLAGSTGHSGSRAWSVFTWTSAESSNWARGVAFKDVNGQLCSAIGPISSTNVDNVARARDIYGDRFPSAPPAHSVGACSNAAVYSGAPVRQVMVPTPDHYIRGVAVCTDTQNGTSTTSIRGVRLQLWQVQGRELTPAGREEFVLDGCNHWHPPVRCPDGELVTQIIPVSARGGVAYRGLEVYCAPIVNRSGTVGRGTIPNVNPPSSRESAPTRR